MQSRRQFRVKITTYQLLLLSTEFSSIGMRHLCPMTIVILPHVQYTYCHSVSPLPEEGLAMHYVRVKLPYLALLAITGW